MAATNLPTCCVLAESWGLSEMFVTSCFVTHYIYIPGKPAICFHYYNAVYDECKYSDMFWLADRVRLFVHYTISLSSLWKLIWRHWTYKMPVRYIKLQKPNILILWFTDFRIVVSTFRNIYVNASDNMTKSDLNRKFKMAATIMAWFSRGIPLGIWQSRRQWNILNTLIKTWKTNLSVGFEYNCWQQKYWPPWPRYDPVSSFAIFSEFHTLLDLTLGPFGTL